MIPVMRRRILTPGPVLHLEESPWSHAYTDGLTGSSHQDGFLGLVPGFVQRLNGWKYDIESLIDRLIVNSPELWPNTKWNFLDTEDFRRVYHWIAKVQSRLSFEESIALICEGLVASLESAYQDDRRRDLSTTQQYFHQRSQRLFRTLADVSRQIESPAIGHALANWFLLHAMQIATTDSHMALGQWCYAILQATMREEDRQECLLAVLQCRSDLPARIVGRGHKAVEVIRSLQIVERLSVQRDMDMHPGRLSVGGHGSSEAHGVLFDRPCSNVRGRVVRSRSHNGRLFPPAGNVERRGCLLDLNGRGGAGRVLLEQESMARHERSSLQMNMDHRFADCLDHFNELQLDDLALDDRFGLLGDVSGETVWM